VEGQSAKCSRDGQLMNPLLSRAHVKIENCKYNITNLEQSSKHDMTSMWSAELQVFM